MVKAGLSPAVCTIQFSLNNHVQAPAKDSPEYNALYSSGALEGQIEAQRVLALRYLANLLLPCMVHRSSSSFACICWPLQTACPVAPDSVAKSCWTASLRHLQQTCGRRCCVWCRRAYQRAVQVPTPALEQLWAAYERFEQSSSNKALGRCVSPYSSPCPAKPQPCRDSGPPAVYIEIHSLYLFSFQGCAHRMCLQGRQVA